MPTVNIGDLKDHLSQFLERVASGEELTICKRNIPVARVVPMPAPRANRTVLGSDLGSVTVLGDLTEPAIPDSDWGTLGVAEP